MATKIVTYEELKAHNTRDNVWLLIHEKGEYSCLRMDQ